MRKLRLLITSLLVTAATCVPIWTVSSHVQALDVLNPVCANAPKDNQPAVCKDNKASACTGATTGTACADDPLFGPGGAITRAVNILSFIVAIISIFVIILFGGLRFITSGGNPQTVASARQTVIFAFVGLVIAAAAKLVVVFVISKVGQ